MSETLKTIGNKNFCKICESSLCINKDSEYFQRCNNTECDCDCEIIINCEGCNNEFTET